MLACVGAPDYAAPKCEACGCECGGETGVCPHTGAAQVELVGPPSTVSGMGAKYSSRWTGGGMPASPAGAYWLSGSLPYLSRCAGGEVAVVFDLCTAYWFVAEGGNYVPRFGAKQGLAFDPGQCRFVFSDCDGTVWRFTNTGTFDGVVYRDARLTSVTERTPDGKVQKIARVTTQGETTTTDANVFEYYADGPAAGRIQQVTFQRSTNPTTPIRRVVYAYYGADEAHGSAGDLKTATVQLPAGAGWADHETSYYRYYKAGDAGGFEHGLKLALGPAAFERLEQDPEVSDPFLATDAQAARYADRRYEYDAEHRVTTSAVAAGTQTFTFAYETSAHADAYNHWKLKVTVTRPDGTQETTFSNFVGQAMLTDLSADGAHWLEYHQFDDGAREVLHARPSAVAGYDATQADLDVTLRTDAGLIHLTTYYPTTTATPTAPGGAAGYVQARKVRQGSAGTPVTLTETTYFERPAAAATTYPVAEETSFRSADGTGAVTTRYDYTWFAGTAQVRQRTTTLPPVPVGQNGTGVSATRTELFDEDGHPVWSRDERGFITYRAYDLPTGAVVQEVRDVDGAIHPLPDGWVTPPGGGLNLTTTYEVDELGRTTKATGPGGRVDYTVYNDAALETRSYPGWDAAANAPTGPTAITREDRTGWYAETLAMSAAPAVSDGRPTGAEAVADVQALSRSFTDAAGRVTHADAYFDLSGLTYSPAAALGAEGVNFYRTRYGYDDEGRQNRVVSPAGTISRTVSDGLGRAASEWVGTDDTPASGDWSPTNPAGMVKVQEYQYDGGGIGDGNRTKVTEYPGLGAADRMNETYFDWRDRAVATKAGVEPTEATDVNRPITYADYDNLDRVTRTRVYDGDGVTITTTGGVPDPPAAGLLRAQTTTDYDDRGRVYRTDTFSVDPATGAVGPYTLNTRTWYDAQGQAVKTSPPGGLVSKTAYDGVGRPTVGYLTDGGGGTDPSDPGDVTGDTVLTQSETAYDAAGNVTLTTTRDRFHDATGTGPLGTPSSGVRARVSFTAAYYDTGDRPVATVNVGTNGGAAWTRPGSVPARSDTVLVTSTGYAADAVQTVRLTGAPTGGTFTLSFGGDTTTGIAYDAPAAAVQTALEGLASVGGGNAVVTAATGGGWQVRFAGALAGRYQVRLTASGAGLTGGTSPGVAVSSVSAGGDAGRAAAVTDPAGRVTRTYADALGRTTQTVEHFTDGAITDSSNKTTIYAHGPAGMTSLTAALTGGGGQTTAWVYGVTTTGGSGLDSNDVVGATWWPDPTTGAASPAEQEAVTVNALGQTVTSTDRNGSVHTLTYDVLGRVVTDAITALGGGVDGAVRRIETAYDGQGNAFLVTSSDAAGGGAVVNQVRRWYNGLGQLTTEWQAHAGAVNTSTTPAVGYAYSEMPGGANHSRLTTVTYPSGYGVRYNYASGLDGTISRLSALTDATGTLEGYAYLGLGTVVVRGHPHPDLNLTYVKRPGEPDGDAGDPYTGLDRFGRVVDQRWLIASTGTATDRFEYGYNRAGNRLYRDNLVNSAFGELYSYDGLNQVASFARGTLNPTKTGISGTPGRTQDWDYDAVGNWEGVDTYGITQARTANRQNEITSITGLATPGYDPSGNMTGDEAGRVLAYDAWNRLVWVGVGSVPLVTYAYDGLNRRVTRDDGSAVTDLYYSAGWQVLEEGIGGAVAMRYVWSPVYVDALVLRDRDTDGNGSLDERLWVQQDANWNVTAVTDGGGVVGERFVYDPFGAATTYSPTWGTERPTSSYAWQYMFQGLRVDGAIGQLYARNREYSPTLGRPMQTDVLRFDAWDVNFYRWEANSPTNRIDPSGLFAPILGPFVAAAASGGGATAATTGGVGGGWAVGGLLVAGGGGAAVYGGYRVPPDAAGSDGQQIASAVWGLMGGANSGSQQPSTGYQPHFQPGTPAQPGSFSYDYRRHVNRCMSNPNAPDPLQGSPGSQQAPQQTQVQTDTQGNSQECCLLFSWTNRENPSIPVGWKMCFYRCPGTAQRVFQGHVIPEDWPCRASTNGFVPRAQDPPDRGGIMPPGWQPGRDPLPPRGVLPRNPPPGWGAAPPC